MDEDKILSSVYPKPQKSVTPTDPADVSIRPDTWLHTTTEIGPVLKATGIHGALRPYSPEGVLDPRLGPAREMLALPGNPLQTLQYRQWLNREQGPEQVMATVRQFIGELEAWPGYQKAQESTKQFLKYAAYDISVLMRPDLYGYEGGKFAESITPWKRGVVSIGVKLGDWSGVIRPFTKWINGIAGWQDETLDVYNTIEPYMAQLPLLSSERIACSFAPDAIAAVIKYGLAGHLLQGVGLVADAKTIAASAYPRLRGFVEALKFGALVQVPSSAARVLSREDTPLQAAQDISMSGVFQGGFGLIKPLPIGSTALQKVTHFTKQAAQVAGISYFTTQVATLAELEGKRLPFGKLTPTESTLKAMIDSIGFLLINHAVSFSAYRSEMGTAVDKIAGQYKGTFPLPKNASKQQVAEHGRDAVEVARSLVYGIAKKHVVPKLVEAFNKLSADVIAGKPTTPEQERFRLNVGALAVSYSEKAATEIAKSDVYFVSKLQSMYPEKVTDDASVQSLADKLMGDHAKRTGKAIPKVRVFLWDGSPKEEARILKELHANGSTNTALKPGTNAYMYGEGLGTNIVISTKTYPEPKSRADLGVAVLKAGGIRPQDVSKIISSSDLDVLATRAVAAQNALFPKKPKTKAEMRKAWTDVIMAQDTDITDHPVLGKLWQSMLSTKDNTLAVVVGRIGTKTMSLLSDERTAYAAKKKLPWLRQSSQGVIKKGLAHELAHAIDEFDAFSSGRGDPTISESLLKGTESAVAAIKWQLNHKGLWTSVMSELKDSLVATKQLPVDFDTYNRYANAAMLPVVREATSKLIRSSGMTSIGVARIVNDILGRQVPIVEQLHRVFGPYRNTSPENIPDSAYQTAAELLGVSYTGTTASRKALLLKAQLVASGKTKRPTAPQGKRAAKTSLVVPQTETVKQAQEKGFTEADQAVIAFIDARGGQVNISGAPLKDWYTYKTPEGLLIQSDTEIVGKAGYAGVRSLAEKWLQSKATPQGEIAADQTTVLPRTTEGRSLVDNINNLNLEQLQALYIAVDESNSIKHINDNIQRIGLSERQASKIRKSAGSEAVYAKLLAGATPLSRDSDFADKGAKNLRLVAIEMRKYERMTAGKATILDTMRSVFGSASSARYYMSDLELRLGVPGIAPQADMITVSSNRGRNNANMVMQMAASRAGMTTADIRGLSREAGNKIANAVFSGKLETLISEPPKVRALAKELHGVLQEWSWWLRGVEFYKLSAAFEDNIEAKYLAAIESGNVDTAKKLMGKKSFARHIPGGMPTEHDVVYSIITEGRNALSAGRAQFETWLRSQKWGTRATYYMSEQELESALSDVQDIVRLPSLQRRYVGKMAESFSLREAEKRTGEATPLLDKNPYYAVANHMSRISVLFEAFPQVREFARMMNATQLHPNDYKLVSRWMSHTLGRSEPVPEAAKVVSWLNGAWWQGRSWKSSNVLWFMIRQPGQLALLPGQVSMVGWTKALAKIAVGKANPWLRDDFSRLLASSVSEQSAVWETMMMSAGEKAAPGEIGTIMSILDLGRRGMMLSDQLARVTAFVPAHQFAYDTVNAYHSGKISGAKLTNRLGLSTMSISQQQYLYRLIDAGGSMDRAFVEYYARNKNLNVNFGYIASERSMLEQSTVNRQMLGMVTYPRGVFETYYRNGVKPIIDGLRSGNGRMAYEGIKTIASNVVMLELAEYGMRKTIGERGMASSYGWLSSMLWSPMVPGVSWMVKSLEALRRIHEDYSEGKDGWAVAKSLLATGVIIAEQFIPMADVMIAKLEMENDVGGARFWHVLKNAVVEDYHVRTDKSLEHVVRTDTEEWLNVVFGTTHTAKQVKQYRRLK